MGTVTDENKLVMYQRIDQKLEEFRKTVSQTNGCSQEAIEEKVGRIRSFLLMKEGVLEADYIKYCNHNGALDDADISNNNTETATPHVANHTNLESAHSSSKISKTHSASQKKKSSSNLKESSSKPNDVNSLPTAGAEVEKLRKHSSPSTRTTLTKVANEDSISQDKTINKPHSRSRSPKQTSKKERHHSSKSSSASTSSHQRSRSQSQRSSMRQRHKRSKKKHKKTRRHRGNRSKSRSRSRSKSEGRYRRTSSMSRSPSIRRRHGSPSHLDKRRITRYATTSSRIDRRYRSRYR